MSNDLMNNLNNKRCNDMNVHNEKILEYIKKNRVVTSSEIAKLLKISWNTADSYLKDLVIDGKIERIKKEGVNLWMKKE
ncbi:MAG: winged helix-turn-helix transcriptional regulator [Nanoarchaeota archaeon]|nr:winged helix-turn-helix transcriptional regulator [Nanoarchaeota archaeon]